MLRFACHGGKLQMSSETNVAIPRVSLHCFHVGRRIIVPNGTVLCWVSDIDIKKNTLNFWKKSPWGILIHAPKILRLFETCVNRPQFSKKKKNDLWKDVHGLIAVPERSGFVAGEKLLVKPPRKPTSKSQPEKWLRNQAIYPVEVGSLIPLFTRFYDHPRSTVSTITRPCWFPGHLHEFEPSQKTGSSYLKLTAPTWKEVQCRPKKRKEMSSKYIFRF